MTEAQTIDLANRIVLQWMQGQHSTNVKEDFLRITARAAIYMARIVAQEYAK